MLARIITGGIDPLTAPLRLLMRGAVIVFALAAHVSLSLPDAARAQGVPFDGVMPTDVGAMAYDLSLSQRWSPARLRMTGYARSVAGGVYWVHCLQPNLSPARTCQMMANGILGERFLVPAGVDLAGWMAQALRIGQAGGMPPDFGPSGQFSSSGSFSWGPWRASGSFTYWR